MSSEEVLRSSEQRALGGGQIVSSVVGKRPGGRGFGGKGKVASLGATAFIVIALAVAGLFLGSANLIPSAIMDALTSETNVQCADGVESKMLVFQQELARGNLPENTVRRLRENDVQVGVVTEGEFRESASGDALRVGNKIVSAGDFVRVANTDAVLYNAFSNATYSCAAYYYDNSAREVFQKIGTSRNNYTAETDFDEVMESLLGEGSNIAVNNVILSEVRGEDGQITQEYQTLGDGVKSAAEDFVDGVRAKNFADSTQRATLNAGNTLNVADTIAKEQKSSLLFLAFMENISKMKAGEGDTAKINEMMNTLYDEHETEVVDVATGEVVTVRGSMMEAPSLYAVLSGEKPDSTSIQNYASDRVLKTVENQIGYSADSAVLTDTVTSTNTRLRGAIGRLSLGEETASAEALSKVTETVNGSLVKNSFHDIQGVEGGEMLVEGAVSVGRELAKASGATTGDAAAVKSYARLNNSVLALEAESDRMNRSPFDITSKNTFLGSIMYNFALILGQNTGLVTSLAKTARVVSSAVQSLLPVSYADDTDTYLTNFGDCTTLNNIGAVGTTGCSAVVTFDTSTLNDVFNNSGFVRFVEENTEVDSAGNRTVLPDSVLADFIKYNNEKITPAGVTDGGILQSLSGGSSKIPFVSDILTMVKNFLGASEQDKRIASGAAFVNSELNSDWATYKYAQRYVSLARATEALRQYDGGQTAYTGVKFFEGTENPVVAFTRQYLAQAKD